MTNVQLVSDLHLEFGGIQELINSWVVISDTLLMAGDIVEVVLIRNKNVQGRLIRKFFKFISDNYKQVYWIMGNHEHWGNYIEHTANNAKSRMKELGIGNIQILDNEQSETKDFNIFGATMWTNVNKGNPSSMMNVGYSMNDYTYTKKLDEWLEHRKLSVEDTCAYHKFSMYKIESFVAIDSDKPKIIMTHHAPTMLSLHDYERSKTISHAYASDLYDFVYNSNVHLWCHGHIHEEVYYAVGNTIVASNPRGYFNSPDEEVFSHISINL